MKSREFFFQHTKLKKQEITLGYCMQFLFLNLVEYIVQIGSSFGMWFGLSISSFNPMKGTIFENNEKVVVQSQQRQTFLLL